MKVDSAQVCFEQKWLQRHLEAEHESKKFYLRPAQEFSKVPKICSYLSTIFFNSFWPVQANSAYWFFLHTKKLVDDSANWFFFKIDYPKLHIDRDTCFKLMNVLFAIENFELKMYLPAYSNYTPKAYRLLLPA